MLVFVWGPPIPATIPTCPLKPSCLLQVKQDIPEGEEGEQPAEPAVLCALATLRDPFSTPENPLFHSNAVCGVALSGDGARLASGGNDMQVG